MLKATERLTKREMLNKEKSKTVNHYQITIRPLEIHDLNRHDLIKWDTQSSVHYCRGSISDQLEQLVLLASVGIMPLRHRTLKIAPALSIGGT
jgi:hypothetical protein